MQKLIKGKKNMPNERNKKPKNVGKVKIKKKVSKKTLEKEKLERLKLQELERQENVIHKNVEFKRINDFEWRQRIMKARKSVLGFLYEVKNKLNPIHLLSDNRQIEWFSRPIKKRRTITTAVSIAITLIVVLSFVGGGRVMKHHAETERIQSESISQSIYIENSISLQEEAQSELASKRAAESSLMEESISLQEEADKASEESEYLERKMSSASDASEKSSLAEESKSFSISESKRERLESVRSEIENDSTIESDNAIEQSEIENAE